MKVYRFMLPLTLLVVAAYATYGADNAGQLKPLALILNDYFFIWFFLLFAFLKAEMKLKEEEQRAVRYLETRKGCDSVTVVSYM